MPEVPAAHSQARTLREVEATARDLVAVMLDVPADSFGLDVHLQLPAEVAEHVRRTAELREQAARAQAEAATEIRAAARQLHDGGMPLRDVGQALGASYQRAHQLITSQ